MLLCFLVLLLLPVFAVIVATVAAFVTAADIASNVLSLTGLALMLPSALCCGSIFACRCCCCCCCCCYLSCYCCFCCCCCCCCCWCLKNVDAAPVLVVFAITGAATVVAAPFVAVGAGADAGVLVVYKGTYSIDVSKRFQRYDQMQLLVIWLSWLWRLLLRLICGS